MNLTKVKSLDLFENGNYKGSFDTWKDVEKYFKDEYEYHKSLYWSDEETINKKIISRLNDKRFHVVESFKLIFKD